MVRLSLWNLLYISAVTIYVQSDLPNVHTPLITYKAFTRLKSLAKGNIKIKEETAKRQ